MTGTIIVIALVALPVALFVFDWVRTTRIKKSLAAGGRAPGEVAARHTNTQANYAAISAQANSTRNQSSGFTT